MRRLMIASAASAGLLGLAACGEQRPEETATARAMPDTGAAATQPGETARPEALPAEEPAGTGATPPPSQ